MKRFALLALAAAAVMSAGAAMAQMPALHIVRGVVAAVTPDQVTITARDGKTVAVKLAPNWMVSVLKPIPVDAIQPGSFIGTTEMPQADGSGVSVEVHVFPAGIKMGEGHYPWDLQPGAMMTNGTVGTVKSVDGGRAIDVTYPSGTRHIVVPANVPIVQITVGGDRGLIHPGVSVFLVAGATPDGGLATNNVSTGVNGTAPPM